MHWKQFDVETLIQIKAFHSLFLRHYEKGYDFLGETHGFWECVYVVSGKVCVTADERVMLLSAGDIIFHKPFELHKFFVESPDGADLLIFSFTAQGHLQKALQNKVLALDDFQKEIVQKLICYLKVPGVPPFSSKSCLMPLAEISRVNGGLQMVQCFVSELILSIADATSKFEPSGAADADLFSKAVAYMNSNVDAPLSVEEIAKWVNTSTSGLKRTFQKYAKMGVHRYFLLLKMQAATKLLQQGMSVGETAERLGFSSQGYFSACYKRETGENPSKTKLP